MKLTGIERRWVGPVRHSSNTETPSLNHRETRLSVAPSVMMCAASCQRALDQSNPSSMVRARGYPSRRRCRRQPQDADAGQARCANGEILVRRVEFDQHVAFGLIVVALGKFVESTTRE